jgi:Fe-S cluster assembly ATPase SufC
LMNGKIVKSGGPDLALELEKKGYENFNKWKINYKKISIIV